ncbi:MAG: response regulator [Pirellulales bacterium]|nr:response regulator [Pirellulales bacterium]
MIAPRQILHIDDDPQFTTLVAEMLKSRGYLVTSLHDPSIAIQQLPRFRERVVLLDIDMPRTNGLELLQEIKAFDGGIQVVMLTGLVTMTTVLQSLRLGAEACFFKPIEDIEPLAEAIADCFRKIDRWWLTLNELLRRKGAPLRSAEGEAGSDQTGSG